MRIMTKSIFAILLGFLLGVWLTPAAAADAMPLAEADYEGVAYLNGGIGQGEVAQMMARAGDFSLKLVLAEKSGAYLADVKVVIFAAKNRTVLKIPSAGPIVLARLPAGHYRVEATFNGEVRQRTFRIAGGRHVNVTLHW